jgi:hypothetical protein
MSSLSGASFVSTNGRSGCRDSILGDPHLSGRYEPPTKVDNRLDARIAEIYVHSGQGMATGSV